MAYPNPSNFRSRRPSASRLWFVVFSGLALSACGGGGSQAATPAATDTTPTELAQDPDPAPDEGLDPTPLDEQLRELIDREGLAGDAAFNRTLPQIDSPLAQLGMKLFFSKTLGGDFDSACVSCHHPALGGADDLSLSVGVDALNADLVGIGRRTADGLPVVPRNSPTVFNAGLWDAGMFWDSRVESFAKTTGANGAGSDIRTPDVAFDAADPNAGDNLPAAQARFPVTARTEMRGAFEPGGSNSDVRDHLAARIGNYGIGLGELAENTWLAEFQAVFGVGEAAEQIVTFDNIALALAEYQRSMVFTANPFADYVNGDLAALTEQQKEGAVLFYQDVDEGGGGCANCHSGDRFTDESHHVIGFPQIGPGNGNGQADDFGRAGVSLVDAERYHFRTPSLLNVALTAPYGHAGAYASLGEVLQHYNNPRGTVNNFFEDDDLCDLPQFASLANCENLYPLAEQNTDAALDKLADERADNTSLFEDPNLNNAERADIVAFLQALTDPCAQDRDCLAPWIAQPGSAPDAHQLNAVDQTGQGL